VRGRGGAWETTGEYISMRRASDVNNGAFTNYAFGYIAAYNLWGTRTQVVTPDAATVLAYLDKYCADHPLGVVATGVDGLIADLGGHRLGKPTRAD
jgi:hypothetical protein